MNALGAVITATLCLIVFSGSRRWAIVAVVLGVIYLTEAQGLHLGFNFTAIRLVLLAGIIRVIARRELSQITTNRIDRALIAYGLFIAVIATLRVGTTDQLIGQLGGLYNIFLSYFVCRALLQSETDFRAALSLLSYFLVPFALLMISESNSGHNPFEALGLNGEVLFRDGHFRSACAFRSPITAGSFGATFAMLYGALIFAGTKEKKTYVGVAASLIIIVCARSSGPVVGLIFGMLALACWRLKTHTPLIRRGIVVILIVLHIVMKAPVWFLIAKVSDVIGGGGYHRAELIDQFVNHFGTLWLCGTNNTSDWFPYELASGGADLTNIFVANGVTAGIVGVIVTILLFTRCFQGLGVALDVKIAVDLSSAKLTWALGATLTGTIAILFSVTYFDQMYVILYMLLASIGTITTLAPISATQNRNIAGGRGQLT